MALIRWDPTPELQSLQSEFNRLFDAFFGESSGADSERSRWLPAMDLLERDNEYVLRLDLPGVDPKDVKVELENNVLTVSGERKAQHEERRDGAYRLERGYGRFARSLTLPEGVDPAQIAARLENGVLEVRVPKPEERKPQRIAIDIAQGAPVIDAKRVESGTGEQAGAAQDQPVGAAA